MKTTQPFNIAVIFPDWYAFLNEVVEGVLGVQKIRSNCHFRNFIVSDFSSPVDFPQGYKPDGILVSYDDDNVDAPWLSELNIPVVNIFSSEKRTHPTVGASLTTLARVAVDHFCYLGFTEVGILATEGQAYSQIVYQAFTAECHQRGLPLWKIDVPDGITAGSWAALEDVAPELKNRLTNPQGKTGIYAFHDMRARLLADYCTDLGVRIPEDIGILGRFDSINARLSTPELSSIVIPGRKIGAQAIQLLIQLINNEDVSDLHPTVDVTEVRARKSTVGDDNTDLIVLQAIATIRENACYGLTVDELMQTLPLTRSTFEKRYRALTGTSPAQGIRKIRVEQSRQLLLTTRKNLDEIARDIGFTDSRAFVVFFKREVGVTPGEFRQSNTG